MSNLSQHSSAPEGVQPIGDVKMAANEKRIFRGYIVTSSKHMRSNLFKAMILAFIGLLAGLNGAFAASVGPQANYGPVIYSSGFGVGGQQYEASAIRFSPTDLRVWTCGTEGGRDTIFLTWFNTDHPRDMSNLNYAGQVFTHDVSDCSPSVRILGSQFFMYYECSPTFSHPSICLATSPDGVNNWTPIATVVQNPLQPWDSGYGVGHPSVVADKDNTNNTLLYFYDSRYQPNGLVCVWLLGPDGVTVTGWNFTNLQFPAKVKYYPAYHKYVATAIYGSDPHWLNIYTSDDGFTFSPATGLLGVPFGQLAQDPGQLVADGWGWIQSVFSDTQALIGGGPDRYSAQIYLAWFSLNLP